MAQHALCNVSSRTVLVLTLNMLIRCVPLFHQTVDTVCIRYLFLFVIFFLLHEILFAMSDLVLVYYYYYYLLSFSSFTSPLDIYKNLFLLLLLLYYYYYYYKLYSVRKRTPSRSPYYTGVCAHGSALLIKIWGLLFLAVINIRRHDATLLLYFSLFHFLNSCDT